MNDALEKAAADYGQEVADTVLDILEGKQLMLALAQRIGYRGDQRETEARYERIRGLRKALGIADKQSLRNSH